MEASILDLRYKMKDVLRALDRNEIVTILYHGKPKGRILPCPRRSKQKVQDHPFFASCSGDTRSVDEMMDDLRGGRHDDL